MCQQTLAAPMKLKAWLTQPQSSGDSYFCPSFYKPEKNGSTRREASPALMLEVNGGYRGRLYKYRLKYLPHFWCHLASARVRAAPMCSQECLSYTSPALNGPNPPQTLHVPPQSPGCNVSQSRNALSGAAPCAGGFHQA